MPPVYVRTGRSAASTRAKRSSSSSPRGRTTDFEQVREPADHAQVLVAGEVLVDRGVLPGEPDALAHRLRVARHVEAEHLGAAGRRAAGSS